MFITSHALVSRLNRLRRRAGLLAAVLALLLPLPTSAQESEPREDREMRVERAAPTPPPAQSAAEIAVQPRIVGGNDVTQWAFRNNFRWMVSVQRNGGHWCGATMIHQRWALTAAHCLHGRRPSELSLLVGTRQLSQGGTSVGITGFVMHPDYDPGSFENDIALLRLDERVRGPRVTPATRAVTNDIASPRTRATILGWGDTFEGSQQGSDMLQRAQVPIVGLGRCRSNYWWRSIPNTMLCAGRRQGGVDGCQGDSGGPIAVQDDDGVWHQVGVSSFGVGCARPDLPGVYSRVGAFTRFINQGTQGRGAACYDPSWPAHFRTPRDFECHSFRGFVDQSPGPVRIGFPVRMGDTTYRELYINNNGNVTFDSPHANFLPGPLEDVGQPIIAPYWNDITTAETGMIHYGRAVINGRRAFMVIWDQVPAWGGLTPGANSFQLVLMEPNPSRRRVDIEFNYARIDYNRNGAYVGFSVGAAGPTRNVEGSGNSLSFIDGVGNALISATNTDRPGRMSWRLRRGDDIR